MRRAIGFVVFGLLVALSMGGTCRQETTQSVISTFFTELAATVGEALGQSLVDQPTP
jgi:hypothetical protein